MSDVFGLQGKRALITGSSRGLGRAIAESMAAAGAHVVIHGRDASAVASALSTLRSRGHTAEAVDGDLSDPASAKMIAARALKGGPVDILVNNAGYNDPAALLQLDEPDWDRLIEVDLSASFRLCRAIAPRMVASRWGRIINIGSVMSVIARAGIPAYAAAKHGLVGLTKAMAAELGPKGITVNAIGPGFCNTELSLAHQSNPEMKKVFLRRTPLGRVGEPTEIAAPAVFLASPAASYINGHLLVVDGGLSVTL